MTSLVKAGCLVLPVLFASSPHASSIDESPADHYLYCANVAQFYYQYFLKHDPNSQYVNTYRLSRDNFRLAAAATKTFTDPASFSAANDAALKKVIAVLERERNEHANLLDGDNAKCADTMAKEVVPLLKPKDASGNERPDNTLQPTGPASGGSGG